MNNVKFAKGTIVTILNKLEAARQKESSKEHKTLSDSLNETINIIMREPETKGFMFFGLILESEIEKEIQHLTIAANKSIENDNFKEHHNWIVAYRKLNSIRENLGYDAKREESKNTSNYYKNFNVYEKKGVHVVISTTQSQATYNIYQKFILDDKEVRVLNNGGVEILNSGRSIHAYGLTDAVRGKRGDVLHIDKSIGLKNYVELVDSLVDRFGTVSMF